MTRVMKRVKLRQFLKIIGRYRYSPPQRFPISLKSGNGRVQCVSIIARAAADEPGPLEPLRRRVRYRMIISVKLSFK